MLFTRENWSRENKISLELIFLSLHQFYNSVAVILMELLPHMLYVISYKHNWIFKSTKILLSFQQYYQYRI